MNAKKVFRQNQSQVISILLITLMVGVAGCAPSTREIPVAPSSSLSPPTSTLTAIPTGPPTETSIPTATPIPMPTTTPFVPKATIRIVSHSPLSGNYSNFGTDIMHAAELAIQQLAGPLIEMGYRIELVPYDDKSNIESAVANANEIIADPGVLCGVGHFTSSITISASEIYHKAGLPFVSPSSMAAAVTDRGYLEVNRTVGRTEGQGVAAAQFANAQGFKKVFIISQPWDYGKTIVYTFRNEAVRLEIKVAGNMATDRMEHFDAIIARVLATKPDVVYFAANADQAGTFFREARAAGYMGAFLGVNAMNTSSLLGLAGPLLVDGGGMYYTDMAAPASYYPAAAKFVEDFQNMYGNTPLTYAAQAFDAAGICLKAIEEASNAKGGDLPTRAEVAKAIRALEDYGGITGTYNFNKRGDPTLADYFVYKVVSVDPNKWDQNPVVASFKAPPPK